MSWRNDRDVILQASEMTLMKLIFESLKEYSERRPWSPVVPKDELDGSREVVSGNDDEDDDDGGGFGPRLRALLHAAKGESHLIGQFNISRFSECDWSVQYQT